MKKFAFGLHVPPAASAYCDSLFHTYQFDFILSRPRRTRLGDFTVRPGATPRITVNANLNSYNFLVTYLHEVAHHIVHVQYRGRKKVAPHGSQWKHEFRQLLLPVLNENVFPEDILIPLRRYAENPKASTSGDQLLYTAIRAYDEVTLGRIALFQLNEGSNFIFQNRQFTKGTLRRTRVLCTDQITKRLYTIPSHAMVEAC